MSSTQQSSSHTDKSQDRNGTDLICGFGRRGRRPTEESGHSSSFRDNNGKHTGSGDNTLICGFGDAGSCSSPDIDEELYALQEGMSHWVFEGNLPGREGSTGSDTQRESEREKLPPDSVPNFIEKSVHAPVNEDSEKSLPDQATPYDVPFFSVATKVEDGSSSKEMARRRSSGELSRSCSSRSYDDISMASEDAVVLMLDLLNAPENDGKNNKQKTHTEICGRIYRHVPNVTYDHLPSEIGNDLSHSQGIAQSNDAIMSKESVHADAEDQTKNNSVSQDLPRNISVNHEIFDSIYKVTSKQGSQTQNISNIPTPNIQSQSSPQHLQPQDTSTKIAEIFPRPKKIEVYNTDMIEGYLVEEEKYGQICSKLEMAQRRRSKDLDIIEEGSRDSQSESMLKTSFASKTSQASSRTSSDGAFDDVGAFDADIDPEIDILEIVASHRQKAITGEHAKSMAKELKAPVKTRKWYSSTF